MLSKKSLDFAGMNGTPTKGKKARGLDPNDLSPTRKSTPPSVKRPRYFGHSPNPATPKRNLKVPKNDIAKLPFEELDSEGDKLLHLIVSYGYREILQLNSILQKIPKNFTNRLKYFCAISKFVTNLSDVSEERMKKIASSLERQCIPTCNVDDILWQASNELKTPYMVFLSPSTDVCLETGCHEKLYGSEKEITTITLFTMDGPVPGVKCVLYCKACGSRYGLDKYRPRNGEARYYPDNMKSSVVPASNKVYFTEDLFEFMCEAGNHGFVSAQAFSQTYVSVYHSEHPVTKRFSEWKSSCFGEGPKPDCVDDGSSDFEDSASNTSSGQMIPNPFMSRKSALEATFNGELEKEVRERRLVSQMTFKYDSCREANMKKVDELRRTELYPHPPENCNDVCQSRGCQNLRVIDSCWKLCIPHCMLAVQTEVDGFPLLNFPNICSDEPKPGSVFCESHHQLLEEKSVPTEKGAFLKFLGCKENPQSQEDIKRVDQKVLDFMSSLVNNDSSAGTKGTTATAYQGTDSIIKRISPETLNDQQPSSNCNKDTGEKGRLRQRARGHFAAVTGGGNILCFNPIYKSESPSQVFMLTIQMMYEEFKDVPESELDEKIENYILAYDNMCNLDKIKAANCDLPLPGKMKTMWQRIRKIVDRLHMKNHRSKCCQQKYSPDNVLKPDEDNMNTMAAEQLFSWMSRFKKIVNSMTQTHHLFYLHRMCVRRNRRAVFLQKHTKDGATLAHALNLSWKNGGGLYCYFKNIHVQEMMEMLDTQLRTNKEDHTKKLVEVAGRQPDDEDIIAVNPSLFLNSDGEVLTDDQHNYLWISEWTKAPGRLFFRNIPMPVSVDPLSEFIASSHLVMEDNFGALMLCLGAMVSMLNYQGVKETVGHFNTPLCYGPPMAGKTLAATCVALVLGMNKNQISSRNTSPFLTELLSKTTFPFVWDDPSKELEVKLLAGDLGNGCLRGTAASLSEEAEKIPLTGCLITANFNLQETEKYYTRICLIPFKTLNKTARCGEGPELEEKARAAASALPMLLKMTKTITKPEIVAVVEELTAQHVKLRICEGISVPLYFARKILALCNLELYNDDVTRYAISIRAHHQAVAGLQATDERDPVEADVDDVVPTPLLRALNGMVAKTQLERETILKITNNNLNIRLAELSDLTGVDRISIRDDAKSRGCKAYGHTSRFKVTHDTTKTKTCTKIPIHKLSDEERDALEELNLHDKPAGDVQQEQAPRQPDSPRRPASPLGQQGSPPRPASPLGQQGSPPRPASPLGQQGSPPRPASPLGQQGSPPRPASPLGQQGSPPRPASPLGQQGSPPRPASPLGQQGSPPRPASPLGQQGSPPRPASPLGQQGSPPRPASPLGQQGSPPRPASPLGQQGSPPRPASPLGQQGSPPRPASPLGQQGSPPRPASPLDQQGSLISPPQRQPKTTTEPFNARDPAKTPSGPAPTSSLPQPTANQPKNPCRKSLKTPGKSKPLKKRPVKTPLKELNNGQIYNIKAVERQAVERKTREVDQQSAASVQGSHTKRCAPSRNTVKFLHKKIRQKFEEDGQIIPYEGFVEQVIKGRDGWKKAVYRVKYDDGQVLELNLREDYDSGDISFLN